VSPREHIDLVNFCFITIISTQRNRLLQLATAIAAITFCPKMTSSQTFCPPWIFFCVRPWGLLYSLCFYFWYCYLFYTIEFTDYLYFWLWNYKNEDPSLKPNVVNTKNFFRFLFCFYFWRGHSSAFQVFCHWFSRCHEKNDKKIWQCQMRKGGFTDFIFWAELRSLFVLLKLSPARLSSAGVSIKQTKTSAQKIKAVNPARKRSIFLHLIARRGFALSCERQ
jgi:hypothetical protein